ncbi:MAG TPA: class I SAM-dependent methyltransferase [Flavobacteriales bacterium]|nr:class I SAM-dependent methyltransferase [Flavobacteriales bacterium]HRE74239.1 class I SAM-dependent methyltransferase [Flavobacteriales bacterium]HRE95749.1 class I SAM-dependent methyltransferase [Flavobacteriales bacterium]HRJ36101.1 class I SAM-dependent methyltransferase [Flavobacteriales bacterium]
MLQPQIILQWDVRNWSKALRYWEQHVEWSQVNECLELGGREGGLSLWLAEKGKTVVCSDLENTASTAGPQHEKFPFSKSISYRDIDATSIPFENKFDLIVFKSILGGIGRNNDKKAQQAVFATAFKALKPGGVLLFAENLQASALHRYFRKRFTKWSAYWRYPTFEEFEAFSNKFVDVQLNTNGFLGTFGRTEKQRHLLSFFDKLIFDHITPKKKRYIIYGICTKPNQK